jgi:hypothetical protein
MDRASERQALLRRIDELIESPTLVHLVDHYVERLIDLDARVSTTG